MRVIAPNASAGVMSHNDAAAAASAALPTLTSPGNDSSTSYDVPSGAVTVRPETVQSGVGRDRPQPLRQPDASRVSTSPHTGQAAESDCHRWPAETLIVRCAHAAPQATSGPSQFSTASA